MKPENQGLSPQAIVILGGGVRRGALDLPQYQNQDVSKEAMESLRMGARLAKVTQLPILVTGGGGLTEPTFKIDQRQISWHKCLLMS